MYKFFFKRIIDLVLSLVAFIIFIPLFLVITIILYFSNDGRPFFFQTRPGRREKVFKIIKFKTMNDRKDAEGNLLSDAERLTSVGSFVRKTSLDEIPQLLNIIKGDMSLIGPRPLLIQYLPYYTERERIRHSVRPGITGLAQVNGRNNLMWDDRLEMDVRYVETLSFKNDVKIFFKTILNVIQRKDIVIIPGEKFNKLDYYRKNENKR